MTEKSSREWTIAFFKDSAAAIAKAGVAGLVLGFIFVGAEILIDWFLRSY